MSYYTDRIKELVIKELRLISIATELREENAKLKKKLERAKKKIKGLKG